MTIKERSRIVDLLREVLSIIGDEQARNGRGKKRIGRAYERTSNQLEQLANARAVKAVKDAEAARARKEAKLKALREQMESLEDELTAPNGVHS